MRRNSLAVIGLILLAWPASATDLVYQPVNPSFGGSPLNSAHLLGIASAQRNATASDYKAPEQNTGTGTGTGTATNSDADLFVRQLQGRLLSALAAQVTDAIFGDNPQDNGTVQFGDTTVTFARTVDSIRLTIVNAADGTVTDIVVPQLVTSTGTPQTAGSAQGARALTNSLAATAGTPASTGITGTLQNSNPSGIY